MYEEEIRLYLQKEDESIGNTLRVYQTDAELAELVERRRKEIEREDLASNDISDAEDAE